MEIKNYTSALNAYRYASEAASRPLSGKAQKSKGKNTDKAEFSSSARASFSDTLKTAAKAPQTAQLPPKDWQSFPLK